MQVSFMVWDIQWSQPERPEPFRTLQTACWVHLDLNGTETDREIDDLTIAQVQDRFCHPLTFLTYSRPTVAQQEAA